MDPNPDPNPNVERKKFSLSCIKKYFEEFHHNDEQLKFIYSPIESSSLNGIPGGGKTRSIISKIIYHFLNSDFTKTSDYKLFTFSKRACSDFILKGRAHHPRIFNASSIQTIHSLSGKLLYHIHKKRSSSKNSVILCATHLFDNAAYHDMLRSYEHLSSCRIIFVDEAQDISDIQYKLIMKISDFYKIPVIMIGDPNQNIYQFQNGSDRYLLEHPGQKYYLIKNYRSTPQIVNLVNSIRPWDNLTPKMISARVLNHGYMPLKPHVIVDSIPNIISYIIQKIRDLHEKHHISYEEMAIIGPVKKSKPNADYYTNIGLSLFTNFLSNEHIPYVKHYEDGDSDGSTDDRDIEYKAGHVNLFTIHGSKGLEFKAVFLLNFHLNTFGIAPTEEDYNRFKYLWYVGLSRAADYLYIFVDERKYAWYDLKQVSLHDIIYERKFPKLIPKVEFKEEIRPLMYGVLELLRNKKYMNDHLYHYFFQAFGERTNTTLPLWSGAEHLPKTYDVENMDFYKIYGIFMEHIFNFYYHYPQRILPDFVVSVEKIMNNTIEIPKQHNRAYGILRMRLPQITKECITLSLIHTYKNILTPSEMDLYAYLCVILENNYHKEFYLQPTNHVISYPRDRLFEKIALIKDYLYNVPFEEHAQTHFLYVSIFEMAIFQYQREHESAYLWKCDFVKYVDQLMPHIKHISQFAQNPDVYLNLNLNSSSNHSNRYRFHEKRIHPHLPLVGEFDMINHRAIVDLKFSNASMEQYYDQLLIYYMIYDPSMRSSISLELWNLLKGERVIIHIDRTKIQKMMLLQVFCKAMTQKLRNMVFIYDLETTGLLYTNQKIDIIERHVVEYSTRSIWSTGLVKPIHMPFIPFEITQLTGITKEMVYTEGSELSDMKAEFENIFRYCENPVFVAHNGKAFDHKILMDLDMIQDDACSCVDSRYLLRLWVNQEKPLGQLYAHYFPERTHLLKGAHRADFDVSMLIDLFEKLGIQSHDFISIS